MSTFTTSKYIKAEPLKGKPDLVLTISSYEKKDVGTAEKPKEAWVLYFEEVEEGFILNKTTGETIAHAVGSFEMDDWVGKKIALYYDKDVSFGGKKTGGLRVREDLK